MVISPAVFKRLCRARQLLEADDPPALRALADQVGLSPFHLIRAFRALFGVTPHQHRTRARLDRAQRLLGGGHSVTAACLEVGFSSLGSFSHLFERRLGVTPSAFRRRPLLAPQAPGCIALMTSSNFRQAGTGRGCHDARP